MKGSLDSKQDKQAKVAQVGFVQIDLYEGLSKRIKAGELKLTSLSTPTRLTLLHYEAAKREHEAMKG